MQAVHPKVKAAGLAGIVSAVVIAALAAYGISNPTVTALVQFAVVTGAAYLKSGPIPQAPAPPVTKSL